MKRNTLYTVNRWNRPAFAPNSRRNLFAFGNNMERIPEEVASSKPSGMAGLLSGQLSNSVSSIAPLNNNLNTLYKGFLGAGNYGSTSLKGTSASGVVSPTANPLTSGYHITPETYTEEGSQAGTKSPFVATEPTIETPSESPFNLSTLKSLATPEVTKLATDLAGKYIFKTAGSAAAKGAIQQGLQSGVGSLAGSVAPAAASSLLTPTTSLLSSGASSLLAAPTLAAPTVTPYINMGTASGRAMAIGQSKALVDSFGKTAASQGSQAVGSGAAGAGAAGAAATGASKFGSALGASSLSSGAAAGIGIAGSLIGQGAKYLISDGYSTGAGNAIADIGGLAGGVVGYFNPVIGAIVSAATGIIGGAVNRAFSIKTDEEALANNEVANRYYTSYKGGVQSLDDIPSLTALTYKEPYKSGWFKSADDKNENAKRQYMNSRNYAQRGVENDIYNIMRNKLSSQYANSYDEGGAVETVNPDSIQGLDSFNTELENYELGDHFLLKPLLRKRMNKMKVNDSNKFGNGLNNVLSAQLGNALTNFAAYGGPFDRSNMGAIEYGLLSDYISSKKKQANNGEGITNLFAGMPNSMFAFGGDMQTNSADFPTGLTHIDAGGSHELNPYDGVQVGVDSEGAPNLVEEGETIYNDYVLSNRILADEATKELFHLPKKKDITFADISKKLEKQIAERPNDPLSRAGFESQMQRLTEQQERQKQEMEAERAKAAFEALSPEEKAAIIQQQAIEENMGNQGGISPNSLEMPMPDETQGTEQPEVIEAEGGNLFRDGGSKKRKNVGTWKDDKQNHWDVFTKPGLKRYIENLKAKLNMAPDDETKNAIRREAMSELNTLQQSYYDHVREGVGKSNYGYDENVEKHQRMFDRLYGNTGFYSKDDEGNVRNLIAEAINLPKGAATDDKPDNWFDGYNGPRTSIRNFGSTEYGDNDYYSDLVKEFADLGLTYSPNQNWKYGENQLYGLSIPEEEKKAEEPKIWDGSQWTDKPVETPIEKPKPEATKVEEEDVNGVKPKHRAEWMRYAGIFGPALGLGLMGAGVGKPDTSGLEAAVKAGNAPAHLADYKPLGNYLRYRPMDIWFEQNRMDANARAADRAILNNAAPTGTKMAGILANGYNNQIAAGELYRKALEYNDAKKERVAEFNRGTDQFNAEAYNRTSQFNAEALNRQRQYAAQLALQAAREKMDADAAWTSGIYGNLSGLFKGISDIGRENALWNMASSSAADGVYGNLGDSNTAGIYTKPKKKCSGGKIKKRGLTY